MNIKFEKNKLLDSIIGFDCNIFDVRNNSKNFILKNSINDNQFNIDNILYLRQILDFSKLKYINSNYDKIEEKILNSFQDSSKDKDFYLNKLNIIKKLPISLLSNLEVVYFELMIAIKNIKDESQILQISEKFNVYRKKLKELTEIISDSLNEKLTSKNDRYQNLILFQNPNFSCENFEKVFDLISLPLRNAFENLMNNSKCIKFQKFENALLKNSEFLNSIDSFLKDHFNFSKYFEEKNLGQYFFYYSKSQFSDENLQNSSNVTNFKQLFNIKIKDFIDNFLTNLLEKRKKVSDLHVLFGDFQQYQNYHAIHDFILNFYSNSQFFIENLANFLKKTSKIKGKVFDSKNIFWLLNCYNDQELICQGSSSFGIGLINNFESGSNELIAILSNMIQYVIEKDFINNIENLNLTDLMDAWKSGVKHYFGIEVSNLHFIQNFNFNPFESGIAGFKVFSNLQSSKFYNQFFEDQNFVNSTLCNGLNENNSLFFKALDEILNFENKILPFNNDDLQKNKYWESIFEEYKKYLKNKFGIVI